MIMIKTIKCELYAIRRSKNFTFASSFSPHNNLHMVSWSYSFADKVKGAQKGGTKYPGCTPVREASL